MSAVDPNQIIKDSADVATEAAKEGKAFYKSKTFWANALLAGAHYFGYLPAQSAPYVFAAANVALRVLTNQPITFGG